MPSATELVDIHEVRRRNLEILIDGAGSVRALGDRMLEWQQRRYPNAAPKDYANTLSQYRTGKKMGARFARDLEESVSRPRNWMDVLQPDPAEQTVLGREAAQIVVGLDPEDQDAAMRILRGLQAKKQGLNNPFFRVPPKSDDSA